MCGRMIPGGCFTRLFSHNSLKNHGSITWQLIRYVDNKTVLFKSIYYPDFFIAIFNIAHITHLSPAFSIKGSPIKNKMIQLFILLGDFAEPVYLNFSPE